VLLRRQQLRAWLLCWGLWVPPGPLLPCWGLPWGRGRHERFRAATRLLVLLWLLWLLLLLLFPVALLCR
jgi:hypothetical protein